MNRDIFQIMSHTKPQIQDLQRTKSTHRHIIFKLQKTKDKDKSLKEARGRKNTLSTEEQRYQFNQTSPQKPSKQEEYDPSKKNIDMFIENGNIYNAQYNQKRQKKRKYKIKNKNKTKSTKQRTKNNSNGQQKVTNIVDINLTV